MKRYCILFLFILFTACLSLDVDKCDSTGNTLLLQAIKRGDLLNAKNLIQKGANVNKENRYGINPLRLAVLTEQPEMVKLLVKHKAHCNATNPVLLSKKIPLNVLKMPARDNIFYLTFDLGRDNGYLVYILRILEKYNIRATFFMTGMFIKKYPIDTLALSQSWHAIGNHTYTHFKNYQGKNQIIYELTETAKLYKATTGKDMLKIWRAPGLIHLAYPTMLSYAREIGYQHIDTSLFTKDYVGKWSKQYISNSFFLKLFVNNLDFRGYSRVALEPELVGQYWRKEGSYNGVILLMHAENFRNGDNDFIYTLEPLIVYLIKTGYQFGTSDMFLNQ